MDKCIASLYSRLDRRDKAAFFSVLIFGLITHIHIFSVDYISRDAINIDNLGATYTSGRWMLGFMEDMGSKLLGNYQLPFLNGFASLFLIAVALVLIVRSLEVKSAFLCALSGMIVVAFPAVASHFAFMFTAPAYFLSLLMSTFAVYMFHKRPGLISFVLCALLIAMAVGIYQAYLCFAASYALVLLLVRALRQDMGLGAIVKKGLGLLALIIAGLLLYFLINKAVLAAKGIGLVEYQGLDKMGQMNLSIITQGIFRAYHDQLMPSWPGILTIQLEISLVKLVNIASLLLMLRLVLLSGAPLMGRIACLVLFALCPLAFNSIHIMVPEAIPGVHALMRMSLVFTFLLAVVLCEMLAEKAESSKLRRADRAAALCGLALLCLLPGIFCYRDNTAYLNAQLAEEQAEAYFGSLVTRIRSTGGYRDELPVAYIGEYKGDSTLARLPMEDDVHTFILELSLEEVINENNWREFCALHLGWAPAELSDTSHIAALDEVRAMPSYPDDGSIRIIEDTVVVKFSEP